MKERIPEVQSMLVIHQGALGDFILALPVLATLRKTFPAARSVIMGYPRILHLVEQRFYAEEICSIDQKGMATFFVRQGPLERTLAHFFSAFDLIVVFGKDGEGTLIGNLKRVSQGEILHINPFPKWDEGVHLSDHLLNQLTRCGIPVLESNPRLYLREEDREWGRDFWNKRGIASEERSKTIVLHPGSGSKKKVWPLKQFLSLFHYLQTRLGGKCLIILGPAEGPEVQKALEEREGPSPLLAKGFSLLQLASVMEGCRLFIGNDSGISHMAAALGLPTMAIFGPTDHRVWSPRGERVVVVRREVPCSPCSEERFFLCKGFECLNEIGLSEVLKELRSMGMEV
ncbi:MAG: glycosyltransferase family 9 protein [Thermodesulfobacteriota bacterium]|nr:glycosyltransferase family 9 protein [Thermodesulfobacteriota bacterium]